MSWSAARRCTRAMPVVERRIVGGRGEEGVPVPRAAIQVTEPMPDIGHHAVDVDDRDAAAAALRRIARGDRRRR